LVSLWYADFVERAKVAAIGVANRLCGGKEQASDIVVALTGELGEICDPAA
jgi:hypothetical protein